MTRPSPSSSASALAIAPAEGAPRTLLLARSLAAALLLLLAAGAAARLAHNQHDADALKQRTAASLRRSVIAVRPRANDAARKLALPASLRGHAETVIHARSNGYLSAWHKTIGDRVEKGELLATIDVPELEHELAQARAGIAQAKARLELARSTLKRWEVLHATDSASEQEYEEKRSAVPQAEADLAAAEANLMRLRQVGEFRRVVAPFAGLVSRRAVDVGNLIAAGSQELFAITQIDPLRLTVWVPQAYAEEVKPGQEVTVRFPEAQGKTAPAKVEHLAGALDPVTRSRQADISLPNGEGKFLPGSYAEVVFNLAGKGKTLVVPANVLVIDQAGTRVVVVGADGRIAFRAVKLGRDYGREVEVLEGIGAGDVLVASPSDLLVEGEIVTAQEVAEKKPAGKGGEKAGGKAPS